jgi:hypothetical protein
VTPRVLAPAAWAPLQAAHEARVDAATGPYLRRRGEDRRHPVEDFLFTYYSHRPAHLRRWHPGPGTVLEGAAGLPRASWAFYRREGTTVALDVAAFRERRGATVESVTALLSATAARAPHLGCFGMHEWAMAYRLDQDGLRHADWPLRLGAEGTDRVVESQRLRCTHVDAFRFYTPAARPLNTLQPTRETQAAMEQPGCLHAGMDLYKWAYKLAPAVPSELVMDCFDFAREIRELDMRASPYDLSALGFVPVAVETTEGRAEYAAAQRAFADRGQELRARLLDAVAAIGRHAHQAAPGEGVVGSSAAGPPRPAERRHDGASSR